MVLWGEIEAPEASMIVHVEEKEACAKANRTEGQSRETDGWLQGSVLPRE